VLDPKPQRFDAVLVSYEKQRTEPDGYQGGSYNLESCFLKESKPQFKISLQISLKLLFQYIGLKLEIFLAFFSWIEVVFVNLV
jgi:hypothetical protein